MKFNVTLPAADIKTTYQLVLKDAAATTTLKGFRKGKAPIAAVEDYLDKNKLYQEVINRLLPSAYATYIKKHDLRPITDPKITVKTAEAEKDWEFEIEIAEKPTVTLNKYTQAVKGVLAASTIWTPGKGDPKNHDTHDHEKDDQKLTHIFDALLKTCQVDIPELLIEEEVNHALSNLLNQVNRLGLTIEQYLKSMNKTTEQLKTEYQKTAETNLKLEFILDAIAEDQKITVSAKDLTDFIDRITDPELKKQVESSKLQQKSIEHTIKKRQVVDYLIHLG